MDEIHGPEPRMPQTLDEEIFAIKMTTEEKADLVTFMKEGLASPDYPDIAPPKLP